MKKTQLCSLFLAVLLALSPIPEPAAAAVQEPLEPGQEEAEVRVPETPGFSDETDGEFSNAPDAPDPETPDSSDETDGALSDAPELPEESQTEELPREDRESGEAPEEEEEEAVSLLAGSFAGGSGTEEDPYLIATLEQFLQLSEGTYTGTYFRQIDEIRGISGSCKLGQGCVYDGDGFLLETTGHILGIFNYNSGTIRNAVCGNSYLVQKNRGQIERCVSTGSLEYQTAMILPPTGSGRNPSFITAAGGIAEENSGTISGCANYADVTMLWKYFAVSGQPPENVAAGGIVGKN